MKSLAGKIAVVTGGASGIGLGVAHALGRAGMMVVLADIRVDAVDRACEELRAASSKAEPLTIDVSDPQSVAAAAAKVEREIGCPHVLINNAGVAFHGTPLQQVTHENWQWVIGVNVMGAINCVNSFLPLMKRHGEEAHIVNTASG